MTKENTMTSWKSPRIQTECKQAAEALSASEVRYRRLFETAKDGILILNVETGMVVDVNPFLVELLGLSREVFLGRKVWELGVFKDIVANQDKFEELQQKGYIRYEDLPLETSDGRKIAVEFVSNVYQENGRKVIQCNIRDITESNRVVKKLRESERQLQLSLDSASVVAWVDELSGDKLTEIGPVERIFGKSAGFRHADRDSFIQDIHPDDRKSVIDAMHVGAQSKDHKYSIEFRVLLDGGGVRWLEAIGRFEYDSEDQPVRVRGITRDITERKQAEEYLYQKNALLEAQANSTIDGILIVDSQGKKIFQNQRTVELWKIPQHVADNIDDKQQVQHVMHLTKYPEQFVERVTHLKNHPDETSREEVELTDGTILDRYSAPVLGKDKRNYGRIWVFRDITAYKRSEKNLLNANISLQESIEELKQTQEKVIEQERLSALGHMASGIAHDFNNVLMPIVGFSELLLSDPAAMDDRAEARHMIEMILSAGNDARKIVRRLRAVYREEDDVDYKMIDLSRIVESAVSLTMPKWKEEMSAKGVTIEIVTDFHPVPRIKGHESEIREALTNLIFNAVDAMPKGGVIAFHIYSRDKIFIVVEVTDTGIGMNLETVRRCLEPFFTTKGANGSGLGLSMVYGIVERHEGTVEVESKPDAGTTIRMLFPLPVAAENIEEELGKESEPLFPQLILLIEDEERAQNLIASLLSADNHHVKIAGGGREGLDMLRQGMFDLVITDRAMPKMSGDEVAKEAQQIRPGIPVIMLTGFGDIMKDNRECPLGVSRVMSKPVTQSELRRVMASVLRKAEGGNLRPEGGINRKLEHQGREERNV